MDGKEFAFTTSCQIVSNLDTLVDSRLFQIRSEPKQPLTECFFKDMGTTYLVYLNDIMVCRR